KRVENLPDNSEARVIIERLRRTHTRGYRNGKNDVAIVLALGLTHDATDRLNNIHHRIARVEEDNGIEAWDIDTLRQTTSIGENAGFLGGHVRFQPRNTRRTCKSIHRAIH